MNRRILAVAALAFASGCSTAPSKVPHLTAAIYDPVSFAKLKPRSLALEVANTRQANQKAGNAKQVEEVVEQSLTAALRRDGITVDPASSNNLRITVADYTGPAAEGECVRVIGHLATATGQKVNAESFACHNLQNSLGFKLGGDVVDSYKRALNATLLTLDRKYSELGSK